MIAVLLGAAVFLVLPWFVGPIPLVRGLSALGGFVLLFRIIDLVRMREKWSASRRIFHVLSGIDSRTLRRAPSRLDLAALGRGLLWATLATGAFQLAHSSQLLVQWGAGLVLAYGIVEAGYQVVAAAYGLLGFVTPPLHVLPAASLTIGELWGKRWARPVSAWMRDTCFLPLARRGLPRVGLALSFVVSAIGHAYPVLVATDVAMAALMFAFFAVQAIFVIVETKLGVARWPRAARRVWTVTLMVASSPLFVEPALRVLGIRK